MRPLIPAFALLLLAAPTHVQAADLAHDRVLAERDPWEAYNRWMFGVNRAGDRYLLKPLAQGYKAVAPRFFRKGFSNAVTNSTEPWTFVNAALQGNGDAAFRTLGRFLINSTVGIGGIFNVAGSWGVQKDDEDFGQTLAVWGVPSGAYLMLPGFGPSNPRDFAGKIGEFFGDPFSFVFERYVSGYPPFSISAAQVFDARVRLLGTADKVIDESKDPYVTVRSAWYQNRRYDILNGNVPASSDDPFEDNGSSTPAPSSQPQASSDTPPRIQMTMNLCLARDCSPAELDRAIASSKAGSEPRPAIDAAQSRF